MKKGLTELVFILDRSGSMCGLESDTIGGFNGMINKQKKEKGEAIVTTVLFDDKYELLHDRFPINNVKPITEDEYYVRGCTALLDAIGITLNKIINVEKHLDINDRAEKVIFVIITDGLENASTEYSYSSIRKIIEKQKEEYGWEFLFLGANMDAVKEASRFGIEAKRAVTYNNDSEGVKLNYEVVSDVVCEMRLNNDLDEKWKETIEEDVRKRKKDI